MGDPTQTYVAMFNERVRESGDRTALKTKKEGVWEDISWNQWSSLSRQVAAGLIELGMSTGDKVNIQSNTRYEWVVSDIGILVGGGVTVPIYQSNTAEQCQYIIADSDARFVFVEDPIQVEKLLQVRDQIPNVQKVITFSENATLPAPNDKGRTAIALDDVVSSEDAEWIVSFD